MKRLVPVIAAAALLLGALAWYLISAKPAPHGSETETVSDTSAATTANPAKAVQPPVAVAGAGAGAGAGAAAGAAADPVASARASADPAFLKALTDEAKDLNSTNVDASAAEDRVRKLVAALKPADLRYASELVTSMRGPANERIMAAYSVSQAIETLPPGPTYDAAKEAAGKIVTQGFHSERAEPHSVDELENAQAKSFALMNVDALASRAGKDAAAREELARLAKEAKDPFVQKYILDKLRALPTP